MSIPHSLSRWLGLPSRIALILGLGALSTAGARADAPDQGNPSAAGDELIRSEGGKIFLSEGGRETELQLGASPQRDHLLRLLEEHGPTGVKLDRDPRLIMSGGGGSGFGFWETKKSTSGKPAPASPQDPPKASVPPTSPPNPGTEQGSAPRGHNPANDKNG